ncbi:MAG: benzoate-CoA ligase family protein [Gemmatimonadaceae bacterium]|nr:benzoate-CoA ligase family protein [Gemmatimonadaceae bacterium]
MASSTRSDVYAALPRRFNAAVRFVDHHVENGRGDRVALVTEDRAITYARVHEEVNRVGHALRALGVRQEDRVALLLLDSPAFVYAFWGAMKIGAVPVPMSTLVTARDCAYILEDTRAEVVIVSEALTDIVGVARSHVPTLRHVLVAGRAGPGEIPLDDLTAAQPTTLDPAPTTKDDVAFWLYSSGTTGIPKGVVHLQHDMVVCCEAFGRHVLEITERDRCFSVAKLFFAYGLGNALYFPFYVGASSVLFPGRPEPTAVFDMIARTTPTLFFAVPTAFAALLRYVRDYPDLNLGLVRRCISAGEPLPRSLYERWLARFGREILDGIGSTEMACTFISNVAGSVRSGSSGRVVPGYRARLVNEAGEEVDVGEVGALLVSGESAFAGYWNRHTRTSETLLGHWVRTGDQYVRDEDGYYWYAGRSDDMLKAGGIWVSPVEVENTLLEHEAVREAGVVGAADTDELVKPIAFVVLADGHVGTAELARELREFVRARLAPYKCPRAIVFAGSLPKTATGKIQRFLLREQAKGLAPIPGRSE